MDADVLLCGLVETHCRNPVPAPWGRKPVEWETAAHCRPLPFSQHMDQGGPGARVIVPHAPGSSGRPGVRACWPVVAAFSPPKVRPLDAKEEKSWDRRPVGRTWAAEAREGITSQDKSHREILATQKFEIHYATQRARSLCTA